MGVIMNIFKNFFKTAALALLVMGNASVLAINPDQNALERFAKVYLSCRQLAQARQNQINAFLANKTTEEAAQFITTYVKKLQQQIEEQVGSVNNAQLIHQQLEEHMNKFNGVEEQLELLLHQQTLRVQQQKPIVKINFAIRPFKNLITLTPHLSQAASALIEGLERIELDPFMSIGEVAQLNKLLSQQKYEAEQQLVSKIDWTQVETSANIHTIANEAQKTSEALANAEEAMPHKALIHKTLAPVKEQIEQLNTFLKRARVLLQTAQTVNGQIAALKALQTK